jgi:hypothetical protein
MPGWIKISFDETCHVVWKIRQHRREYCLHAIGDGPIGNRVTTDMALSRFAQAKCTTPWLPVLFPDRAVTTGARHYNCITAASAALWRGWFYWP